MESVRVKAYAKVNLTLFITGTGGGYHLLDSIVATVDMYDLIILKKRKDRLVSIDMRGMDSESIPFEQNNAVKAADLFIEKFGTNGVDIKIFKNIPMGAGLGGSSADAAGVLNGLKKLYKINDLPSLKQIADMTGSDTKYMLTGGYARLSGRGDIVRGIESKLKLNMLMLIPESGVSTAQCFSLFDRTGIAGGNSDRAENALISDDLKSLSENLSNALATPAICLNGEIKECFDDLRAFCPLAVNMTGSGSGVYALFENREMCDYAKSRYLGKAKAYCLKTR